jgi:hypothetical protein
MDITLGDYYHQPSNGILKDVEKSNTPSPDMINLKNKRYINFKEVAGTLRVAMLRNLTGGGKFNGRYLNQNPETFVMSGTFVMEFNVPPDLDGKPQQADFRRLLDIQFPVNFTDDPNKIDTESNGVKFKKANPYYQTQEFLEGSKLVFLDILLDIYKNALDGKNKSNGVVFTIPESIRQRTKDFIENQNLFQKVLNRMYDTTTQDDCEKAVPLISLWNCIQDSDDYRSLSYREKRQYGRDEFYTWVMSVFKVDGGKSKKGRVVYGIKRKEDDTDIDVDEEIDECKTESLY